MSQHGHKPRTRSHIILQALLVALACAVLATVLSLRGHGLRVSFELASETGPQGELFHTSDGTYQAGRSIQFAIRPGASSHAYTIDIPSDSVVRGIRLDIGTHRGPIMLRTVAVAGTFLALASRPLALPLASARINDAERTQAGPALHLSASGADPYVDLTIPDGVIADITRWRRTTAAALGAAAGGIGFVFAWLVLALRGRVAPYLAPWLRWPAWVHRLAATASDDATIRFTPMAVSVVVLALVLGVVGVAAKLNFSSVGMWDHYLPPTGTMVPSTLLGEARAIRSDEWLVQTPWMLSQFANGLPVGNANIGGGRSPLLTSVPVDHAVMAFQPEFWGFAMFDAERAISWFWMYKAVGLFLSAFLLLMLLTRSDPVVSLVGAAWVGLSSYTQWWFSSNLAEILIGFCFALTGLGYACLSRKAIGLVAGLVLLLLGTATFILQLYPPYQVPLGYLALVLIGACAADPARRSAFREHAWLRVGCLSLAAAVLLALLATTWLDARDTILAIEQTAYPGKRSFVGGDMAWWRLFDGLFEAWRIGEDVFPYAASNASESSNFVLLFPLVLVAMLAARRRVTAEPLLVALGAFCCLLAAWMTIPLPAPLATALAKSTLLAYVAPPRALPALGMASILLCATWMGWQRRQGFANPMRVPTWVGVLAVIVVYHYGAVLAGQDRAYFTGWRIMLACGIATLGFLAFGHGRVRAFAVMVLLIAIPAATVNPVAQGLASLLDKPSLRAARDASTDAGTRWIVVGGGIIPQAFKASGLDVFGGPTFLPDRAVMPVLDPSGAARPVWNRYAHVVIDSQPGLAAPGFELLHADIYRIRLDLCSAAIERIGITRIAYPSPAPASDLRCLQALRTGPVDGLWLYRRIPVAGGI